MAFLSNGEGFFPTPPQLEVIRAIQKDEIYAEDISNALFLAVQGIISSHFAHSMKSEINLLGNLIYKMLTIGASVQTIGEEFCHILKVDGHGKALANKAEMLCFYIEAIIEFSLRMLILNMRKQCLMTGPVKKKSIDDNSILGYVRSSANNIWKKIKKFTVTNYMELEEYIKKVQRFQLGIFCVYGVFTFWDSKFNFRRYLHVHGSYQKRLSFKYLGIFIIIQSILSTLQFMFRMLKQTNYCKRPKFKIIGSDIKFENDENLEERSEFTNNSDDGEEEEIPDEEKGVCVLCQNFWNYPTSVACGHIFCWDCISQWCRKEKICPICRESTSTSDFAIIHNYK